MRYYPLRPVQLSRDNFTHHPLHRLPDHPNEQAPPLQNFPATKNGVFDIWAILLSLKNGTRIRQPRPRSHQPVLRELDRPAPSATSKERNKVGVPLWVR